MISYLPYAVILLLVIALLILVYIIIRNRGLVELRARELNNAWKRSEYEELRKTLLDEVTSRAHQEAELLLSEWQEKEEQRIRKDAASRSKAVVKGKFTEQLVPWFPDFPYNPSDARFLGSPVDFIIFDGISEGSLREVVFTEVKTGKSVLNERERMIARVINENKVSFRIIRKE